MVVSLLLRLDLRGDAQQHGFRYAALVRCLETELSFYAQVLDLPHPSDIPIIELAR